MHNQAGLAPDMTCVMHTGFKEARNLCMQPAVCASELISEFHTGIFQIPCSQVATVSVGSSMNMCVCEASPACLHVILAMAIGC